MGNKDYYRNCLFVLGCLFLMSCLQRNVPVLDKVSEPTKIIVDLDMRDEPLSSLFFSKMQLIPLETTSESLIREISKMVVFENRLYVWDYTLATIFVFDESGHYLYKLAKKGHGPGEYIDLSDFFIEKDRREVWVLSAVGQCIHQYSLEFDYIGKIELPQLERAYKSMSQISSDTIAFWTFDYRNRMKFYSLSKNQIIYEDFPEERKDIFCRYEFFMDRRLCRALTNQIYTLDSAKTEPIYCWDFQEKNNQIEGLKLPEKIDEAVKFGQDVYASRNVNYVFTLHGANEKYRYALLVVKNRYLNVFYDLGSQKSYVFEKTKDQIALYPIYWCDDYLISSSEVLSVKDLLPDSLYHRLDIKEEHNPILIKSYFEN